MSADTIYALSSAAGKAGVSVVRVSGPSALKSLSQIARLEKDPVARMALFTGLYDEDNLIDRALVLPFSAPASFTGEDVVEYHIHGSMAVLDALLKALSKMDKHRPADRGEFTRRAFENGKMDLTEAEAVADLIDAQTQAQREQALRQMGGSLSSLYEGWRSNLIRAMAYIEAVIDFPDEDVPDSETSKVKPDLEKLIAEITEHLNDNRRGERLRDGIHIAIVGAPNAGKSSLLNALAKRDIAIVSPLAGTTRDIVEAHLDIAGFPVVLADTAGLRPEEVSDDGGHGTIESEGIRRAVARAKDADLLLLLFDGTSENLDKHTLALRQDNSIVVYTKSDLAAFNQDKARKMNAVAVSSASSRGMDALLEALSDTIKTSFSVSREAPSLTRERHRAALQECLKHLQGAMKAILPELMAEDVRMAARAIGRITGRVDVEDLLDVIFRDFCIGK
ncbi:MAG: tRNA uridine-5-carboxymethylaminomethyl(34) synthesis GTPase MnmE [Micavibrio aeruginosavorus]|uniref:tRNA modification GTPase MnmE n=1 Tax=Micavibrio aeruginosavorus TaxID=349221 RepID=A0A2W5N6I6_9BACT|nr:MAG: tRNA uridine-5-carboxymethylaminomethyl(34) synthesis GTPase MnmE [Micavibrio aeruginosavorus]